MPEFFCNGCRANRFSLVKLTMLVSGYLTVIGDQMTGLVNALNVVKLTLRKQ